MEENTKEEQASTQTRIKGSSELRRQCEGNIAQEMTNLSLELATCDDPYLNASNVPNIVQKVLGECIAAIAVLDADLQAAYIKISELESRLDGKAKEGRQVVPEAAKESKEDVSV